tara:strand:- start:70 stop:1737 length:1668 start_codon:yes stop_codon:yes gene_type:complete
MKHKKLIITAASLLAALTTQVQAGFFDWLGGTSDDWSDNSNWQGGNGLVEADTARIYNSDISSDPTPNNTVLKSGADVTLTRLWIGNSQDVNESGVLTVESGATLTSTGDFVVENNSTLTSSGAISVGNGNGMIVRDSGSVTLNSGATLNKITMSENSTATFEDGSTVTTIQNLANSAQLTLNTTYTGNIFVQNTSSMTVNGTLNGNFGINSSAPQNIGVNGTVNGDVQLDNDDQMTVAGNVNGLFFVKGTAQVTIESTANILSDSGNSWIYNTPSVTWNVGADGSVGTLKTSRLEQNAGQFDGEWRYDDTAVDMVVDLTNCVSYATSLTLKLVSGIQNESTFASNVTFLQDGTDVTADFVWDGAGTGSFTGVLTNPNSSDSDGDGVNDSEDAFPNDASETVDTDSDGVGDNADAFPNDPNETADSDGDSVGDNADEFPSDATETVDTDGDGVGDNGDVHPGYNDAELSTYLSNNSYIVDDGTGGGTGGGLTEQDLIDLRIGSQMASIANDQATLQVVIEQSDDLGTWSTLQTESVTVDAPAGTSKQFFRYRMQD